MNHIPLSLDANRIQCHRHFTATQRIGSVFVDCHTYTCHTACSLIIHAHTACSLIVIHIHTHTVCSLIVIHIHTHTACLLTSLSYIIHLTITITSPWKNDLCTRLKIGQVQRSFIVLTLLLCHRKSVHVHIRVNPVM